MGATHEVQARPIIAIERTSLYLATTLLACPASHAAGHWFKISTNPAFADVNTQLQILADEQAQNRTDHFCVVGEASRPTDAWVYWPEGNKLILWIPDQDNPHAIAGSKRYLDLTRDIVTGNDVHGSTYKLTAQPQTIKSEPATASANLYHHQVRRLSHGQPIHAPSVALDPENTDAGAMERVLDSAAQARAKLEIDPSNVMTKHSGMNSPVIVRRDRRARSGKPAVSTAAFRSPEAAFAATKTLKDRRRLGQFFTPEPIALLMADWICAKSPVSILDPAVGAGAFPRAISERLFSPVHMVCVDVDPAAIAFMKTGEMAAASQVAIESRLGDFLTMPFNETFDAVIANPPYLRHHAMSYDFDIFARIGGAAGVSVSRLANSYILFLLRCGTLLRPGGRMCFIIPAEWTNANFGQVIKEYLLDRSLLRRMAYFNHSVDLFEDALTTSCVLFIEKGTEPTFASIPVHYVPADTVLAGLNSFESLEREAPATQVPRNALRATKKWDSLVRSGATVTPPGFVRLGDLATTKRGIATGANEFFHLTKSEAESAGISARHLVPCIGRAADVSGLLFTNADFEHLSRANGRGHLVAFGREPSPAEQRYIQQGVARSLHKRYLLAIRSPWYSMERRSPAPIWAAVFNREHLRFIYNKGRVHNLTTFHGIFPRGLTEEQTIALVALLNSPVVQSLAAEQVRVYGGGLRKFEPKDLLSILVPDVRAASFPTLFGLAEALCQASESRNEKVAFAASLSRLDELAEATANEASLAPCMLL